MTTVLVLAAMWVFFAPTAVQYDGIGRTTLVCSSAGQVYFSGAAPDVVDANGVSDAIDRLEGGENRDYSEYSRDLDREKLREGASVWCEAARGNDRLTFGALAIAALIAGFTAYRVARPHMARGY